MRIQENAGVRFIEDSKEYKLAEIIEKDCQTKNDVNFDLLKEAMPGKTEEDIKKQLKDDYDFYDYIVNISVYSREEYKDFPDWIDNIYVITVSKNKNKKNWSRGGYLKLFTKFEKSNKIKSCIIEVFKEDSNILGIITHELRHAYTDYIEHLQEYERFDIDSKISSSKISLSSAEFITMRQFRDKDFYEHLNRNSELFCDYWGYRYSKDTSSYGYFIDDIFYYLIEGEMKSHLENTYEDIKKVYSIPKYTLIDKNELCKHINDYVKYDCALNVISELLKDENKMKRWSEYNNGLLGILGAKVVALRQKRDIKDTDKIDARPWLELKSQQLKKILKNINIIIQQESEKARARIVDGEIIIKNGLFSETNYINDKIGKRDNKDYKRQEIHPEDIRDLKELPNNIIGYIKIRTNVPTMEFVAKILKTLAIRLYRKTIVTKVFIDDDIIYQNRPIGIYEKKPYGENKMKDKFVDYLINKKHINTIEKFVSHLQDIADSFRDKIIIK